MILILFACFHRKCFISCQNLDSAKKFKSTLNQALADCGGVFWEDIKDSQLESLLKDMTREYFINGGKAKKAVTVVGRQGILKPRSKRQPENDVYVFNESLQVCI